MPWLNDKEERNQKLRQAYLQKCKEALSLQWGGSLEAYKKKMEQAQDILRRMESEEGF